MGFRSLLRMVSLVAGAMLSAGWLIGGLWLIENTSPILAVGPVAAGLNMYMHLVADALVPGASPAATGFLKLTTALVIFGWVPLAFWSMWTGTPI